MRSQLKRSREELDQNRDQDETKSNYRIKHTNSQAYSLRDSEDRFMTVEKLSDEISILKKERMELEELLLDRDAKAVENRFDLVANGQEINRLRRRVNELENLKQNDNGSASNVSGYNLHLRFIEYIY